MSVSTTKLSLPEQCEAMEIFIEDTLRMMALSGALVHVSEAENGWWCVQFEGGDPQTIPHECAMMLAYGFRLGITHYHAYRKEMGEINQMIDQIGEYYEHRKEMSDIDQLVEEIAAEDAAGE